jgi:hypothetical protein
MTSIKLLCVSTPECHHQGVFWNKRIQVQDANLPEDGSPVAEHEGV